MTQAGPENEIITKISPDSVTAAVSRLTGLVNSKGMRLFAVIDQREEARRVGLDLHETVLVLFGSPGAGTPVMEMAPLAALDLPLKILIWQLSARFQLVAGVRPGRASVADGGDPLRGRHGL